MEKIKKLFNSLMLCFSIVGCLAIGIFFTNSNGQVLDRTAQAILTDYGKVDNSENNPQYLEIKPLFLEGDTFHEDVNHDYVSSSDDRSTYLLSSNGAINFLIGQHEITREFINDDPNSQTGTKKELKTNYAYVPSGQKKDKEKDYYYFKFTSALSLYYNVTNKDLTSDVQNLDNLLKNQDITDFATVHENKNIISARDIVPEKLDIIFDINTASATGVIVNNNKITVNKEGCYTLVISGMAYHTTDDGKTFQDEKIEIAYTFMLFNYSTYLDSGLPNANMSNTETATLTNSVTHSRYYFYNYTYGYEERIESSGDVNSQTKKIYTNLPNYRYNPHKYQLSITYTDSDNNSHSAVIETVFSTILNNGKAEEKVEILQKSKDKDSYGQELAKKDQFVYARYDSEAGNLILTFNNLGHYDLSYEFIYVASTGTFSLPISNLTRKQRLYIYGYQTMYTDYADVDEISNITQSKELKTIDEETSTFTDSADITAQIKIPKQTNNDITEYYSFQQPNSYLTTKPKANKVESEQNLGDKMLETAIKAVQNLKPVSTNQPSIKFKSLASGTLTGYIYTQKGLLDGKKQFNEGKEYSASNINEAGTYLVLLDYTFEGYLSSSGNNLGLNHHYQVFYFTVDNRTPAVNVIDKDGNEISTSSFTNKTAYIIDTSASSLYDAQVTIELQAYDYANKVNIFKSTDIKDSKLNTYGIEYFQNQIVPGYDTPQTGVKIDASQNNPYRNAKYTISIYAPNLDVPGIRSFTIDTNPIGQIKGYNVAFASSSTYVIQQEVGQKGLASSSLVMSWKEKESGASTYGYYKYFPFEDLQYYKSNPNDNNLLLFDLIDGGDPENAPYILPVNKALNMRVSSANWPEYHNSYRYTNSANALNTVPADYVKSGAGLYVFEVYDDAGNVSFETFLIDDTSPVFIKQIVTNSTMRSIAQMNETITVSNTYEAFIVWTKYKGIYIKNFDLDNIVATLSNQIKGLKGEETLADAKKALTDEITAFFNENSKHVTISGNMDSSGDNNDGLAYNSQYLAIELDSDYYFLEAKKDDKEDEFELVHSDSNNKLFTCKLKFFKMVDGKEMAIEGTNKILVRDKSNSNGGSDKDSFLNYPSGYLAINVSSDASAIKVENAGGELDKTGYSLTGQFYEIDGDNGKELTKDRLEDKEPTNLEYKYAYYRPYKPRNQLTFSFKPAPENGSIVSLVELRYYPYVKTPVTIPAYYHGKDEPTSFEATAFYYRLSDTPDRTITIYSHSVSDSYSPDDLITYAVSFDGTGIASPGKYEFVRTYSRDNNIDTYDYYERTLTLYVDHYNVISSPEPIDANGKSSAESIVGGDILLSMYTLNGQSNIQVAYPTYSKDTRLNSGSLYTKDSFNPYENIQSIRSTNKLPTALKIPAYKYTDYYTYNPTSNAYSVQENQSLSRYGDAYIVALSAQNEILTPRYDSQNILRYYTIVKVEGNVEREEERLLDCYKLYVHGICVETFKNSAYGNAEKTKIAAETSLAEKEIKEYKLSAIITFKPEVGAEQYFRTNGTTTDGYLNFFSVTKTGDVIGQVPSTVTTNDIVREFTQPGKYDVSLYQASEQGTTSNSYCFYRFAFTIDKLVPEFDVLVGDIELNSRFDSNNVEEYYTNNKDIQIRWYDTDSEYYANIDKNSILILSNRGEKINYTISSAGKNVNTINLSLDSLWQNGNYIEITMQFEGHNDLYYDKITKRVIIDYSAPVQNLATLMDTIAKVSPMSRLYLERYGRELHSTDGPINTLDSSWGKEADLEKNMQNVSYSYSMSSESPIKYFSYNVDIDFFRSTLKKSIDTTRPMNVQYIYIKAIDSIQTYSQVSSTGFSANDYTLLNDLENNDFAIGKDNIFDYGNYYEVVEKDIAGNMVVYVTHLFNPKNTNEYNPEERTDYAIEYTNEKLSTDKVHRALTDNDIKTQATPNIYSNSGFAITGLNYLDDPWGIYNVSLREHQSSAYMLSPWLEDEVLLITQLGNNLTFTPVSLSSIFNGIDITDHRKRTIVFNNRYTGATKTVYVSVMDTALTTTKVSDGNTAILNINVPTDAQITSTFEACVYPTKITIYLRDRNNLETEPWQFMDSFENFNGTSTGWISNNERIRFIYDGSKILSIRINLGNENSYKFKYEIEDNFGNITTVIQLTNEETCKEIGGENYYITYEPDGSATYLSNQNITYNYNSLLYKVKCYQLENDRFTEINSLGITTSQGTINTINFFLNNLNKLTGNFNYVYRIVVFDDEEENVDSSDANVVKTVQFHFYNSLPQFVETSQDLDNEGNHIWIWNKNHELLKAINQDETRPTIETLTMNGESYTAKATLLSTYSSNVTVFFDSGNLSSINSSTSYLNVYNYSVYLTTDGISYTQLNEYYTSGYRISGAGQYKILIVYDNTKVFKGVCQIIDLTILDASTVFYTVSVDGNPVSMSDKKFTINGREYNENYIVSVDYLREKNRVYVSANNSEDEDRKTKVDIFYTYPTGSSVYVEIYSYKSKISSGYFTVIYMDETSSLFNEEKLTYDDAFANPIPIIPSQVTSTLPIVADNVTQSNYSRLKLTWKAYYALPVNEINIEISKLFENTFVPVNLTIYTSADGENKYTYLTRSGTYRIRFFDSCEPANYQTFGNGNSNHLSIIFLNSAPFTVTYTNDRGEEVVSEPVNKAVYNGDVKLTLTGLSSYYHNLGYPEIHVTRDGREFEITSQNYVYTFTKTGHYVVSFSATSSNGTAVREEKFMFTIVNPNESRYSYEFTPYQNYYVESVIKDGQDITQNLIDFAGEDILMIDGRPCLSKLLLSYFDERTGSGRYTVTINTGDSTYQPIKLSDGSLSKRIVSQNFTFSFWINMSTPPISVSIEEGTSTTKNITVTFNAYNLYNAVGDCVIKIGNGEELISADRLEEIGGENATITISDKGTYYIQVYSMSGNLLYSYKVTKKDPLNVWAIIAIILGVIAVGVIIFITIKLRKRLKVK